MNFRLVQPSVIGSLTIVFLIALSAPVVAEENQVPHRRLLYNFDGDSCMSTKAGGKGPVAITGDDVKRLIEEVAYEGSLVDTVLICINAQVMYYPSKAGTMRGALSTAAERKEWPPSEKQRFENIKRFFDAGVDPYAIILAETKRRGRETLLSFRMNDAHGNDFLRTQFWVDHPDWRLGGGALNFSYDEVRDYVFGLIEEAVQRYDCDGIELDFNRFPTFFKEETTEQRVVKMNSLIECIRKMLVEVGSKRGRRLTLAVRVPSNYGRTPPSPTSCREIGCDVAAWASSGWIDFVTVSEFLHTRYDLPIKPWKDVILNIPVYGGIECTEGGSKEKYLTPEKYRLAARHRWQDGADGIYLFNFFTTREYGAKAWEPPFEVLSELGDRAALLKQGKPHDSITVEARKSLLFDSLPCERIPIGKPDDYKPCIAQLPDGELLLTCFHQHRRKDNKVMEQTLLFRSQDGGKTWAGPEKLDLLGREPYLSVLSNGTIFITGHLLAQDVRNKWGYTTGFLHRSIDRGRTWQTTRVESEGISPKVPNHTTRNVLEMSDGTLLIGADYEGGNGPYFVWRSKDGGQTWDKTQPCEPKDLKSPWGFFGGESWLWQARSGKVWALVRADSNSMPIAGRPIEAGDDQSDHFILFSSADEGRTFDRIRDFGDYGEMYMSLLRLHNKRLLLTFTVRDLNPPLGVRVLLGEETDDGFEFDWKNDRLILDAKTPVGMDQGGGFGPTVQLADDTLVTSYSYRGEDEKTHVEVVRWKLPPQ